MSFFNYFSNDGEGDTKYTEVIETEYCAVNGCEYDKSLLVYDNDGNNYIYYENIDEYLIPFKIDLSVYEYEKLKESLYEQAKNIQK